MRLAFVVLTLLVSIGTAEAQSTAKPQPQAYFPRQPWGYVQTSPDAPSLRNIFVYAGQDACEIALVESRKTSTPNVRVSYTECEPVALGQRTDEAWWLFFVTYDDPTESGWFGSTERAMCEQNRRTTTQQKTFGDARIGSQCQPANLKKLGEYTRVVAQPAHMLVATDNFPSNGWAYVVALEGPSVNARVISILAAKASCELTLVQDRRENMPKLTEAAKGTNARVSIHDCQQVAKAMKNETWWLFPVIGGVGGPVDSWTGSTDAASCETVRKATQSRPELKAAPNSRIGACRNVSLKGK